MVESIIKKTNIQQKEKKYSLLLYIYIYIYIYLFISLPIISKEQEINDTQSDYTYIEIKVRGPGYASLFYYNQNDKNCRDLIFPDELNLNDNIIPKSQIHLWNII